MYFPFLYHLISSYLKEIQSLAGDVPDMNQSIVDMYGLGNQRLDKAITLFQYVCFNSPYFRLSI